MLKMIIFTLTCVLSACTGIPQGVKPVTNLDIGKYQGKWYEIARLDHRFERGMSHVTANYKVLSDGTVQVINQGYIEEKSKWKQAIGTAKFAHNTSIGHLKVSFFGPFYGSYIIFELDHQQYQFAYVTSYNKKYLWLLSRTPTVSTQRLEHFKTTAQAKGFDVQSLIYLNHTKLRNM
ncbi:lipocalin family protein [Pseudoalteromonas sp. MMG005]|uniref:lipocalin family protein n=1 Tax=Pseudoalteromonas sp. MMG005 TaxID=2822682 RepID=UPI001B3A4DC3|nr:lipocalin family protein [Pseudoalteromonas sp. MMG005]MBQ4846762.1 lipocalin family protein [Pseudoalteromonas sp. MMG005]